MKERIEAPDGMTIVDVSKYHFMREWCLEYSESGRPKDEWWEMGEFFYNKLNKVEEEKGWIKK